MAESSREDWACWGHSWAEVLGIDAEQGAALEGTAVLVAGGIFGMNED